ncbi:MAG TPA: TldD/PmbA family protein [Spirochaetota bacterium]|nr:TldD/PmbA family protein [Spirochaetota bacterium]HOM38855.1 TldD/PmbA family protein [Spirochaetota bacterium]HPQ49150.1 TldD/PmbA family protein [Spirochaetota bacterium]
MEEIIKKLKEKNIEADIYSQNIEINSLEFENNNFKGIISKNIEGYGLRVVNNKKEGFSYANKLDNNLIEKAIEVSKFGEEVVYKLPDNSISIENDKTYYDEKIENVNLDLFIEKANDTISDFKSMFPDFYFNITYSFIKESVDLLNTQNFKGSYKKSTFLLSISSSRASDEGMIEIYESTSSNFLDSIECILDRLREKIELSKKNASIKSGEYKLIMTPKALESFVDILLTGFNGKLIEKGISPLIELEGKKKGIDKLSIIDSGKEKTLTASSPFDGDGITSNEKYLIKNGVFGSGIFDIKTASKLNKKPTGNSARSFSSLPSISFRNIIFINGNKDVNNIIREIDKGLIVDQLLGAGMSNVLAGEFSANVDLGFVIDKGEIIGRIKDTMITCNVYDAIERIIDISKETYNLGSFVGPYVLFDKFKVVN